MRNQRWVNAAVGVFLFVVSAGECRGALNDFQARSYTDSGGGVLPYRLFVPLDYTPTRKFPLIVMLHGSGESGTDNSKPASHVSAQNILAKAKTAKYSSFVLVPQSNSGWGSSGTALNSAMRRTLEVITNLEMEFSIDGSRRYCTGLSMGGYGTWDIIGKRPDYFAAAMPVSGWGDPSKAEVMKNVPIWAFHGGLDSIVSPTYSREMIAAVTAAGGSPLYTESVGYGHDNTYFGMVYNQTAMYDWMMNKSLPEPGVYGVVGMMTGMLLWRRR